MILLCPLVDVSGCVIPGAYEWVAHMLLVILNRYSHLMGDLSTDDNREEPPIVDPPIKGTLYVRPLDKGHCFRSKIIVFSVVSIH